MAESDNNDSTAALLRAILPSIILPNVRKSISEKLVQDGMVMHKEQMVEGMHQISHNKEEQVLGPIKFHLDAIQVLDYAQIHKDVQSMPEFDWPESNRMKELMENAKQLSSTNVNRQRNWKQRDIKDNDDPPTMLILDIIGVNTQLSLGPNIELIVPAIAEGSFWLGGKMDLEIGTGGSIQEAGLQILIPKLRVWFVSDHPQQKVYLAFLGRPRVLPRLHVNADRGQGDFCDVEITPQTSFDDMIESILCGFGPSSLNDIKQDGNKSSKDEDSKTSWVGKALGGAISQAVGSLVGQGDNRPFKLDLSETKEEEEESKPPRSVQEIEADMERLKEELELAKAAKKS